MKTYITWCLITILLSTMNAFAQPPGKTRRSTPQPNISRPTDFGKFIGTWEFDPDNSITKGYFKITEDQPRRFKFIEGFEYQGRITWAETMVNRADGIYLNPLNGKLGGRFTSPNFRATHGHDITYRLTLSLEPSKLLYSVTSGLGSERYRATKVNNGDDRGEVVTSNGHPVISQPKTKTSTLSFTARKVLADKSWQAFWTKFSGAIHQKNTKTLVQLSSADADFFDGGGGGTSQDWFEMMSSEWGRVKKAIMSGVGKIEISEGQISRSTNKHIPMIFSFEKDNKWRFSGVMGD